MMAPSRVLRGRTARRARRAYRVEALEGRQLLATFAVTNLSDSGPGSLRSAILGANDLPGADTIDFDVAGTIRVGRASLPAITGAVTIDGTSAPGYAGTPVVTVNFRGTRGLTFNAGSAGSTVKGLSLVGAGTAGVTLNASFITVQGNDIGVLPNGLVVGNRGDGVRINRTSSGDLVGQADPVTGVSYYDASGVGLQPVSGWQGIRDGATPGQYILTGTSNSSGLLYEGPISGVGGTSYAVNVPGATASSVYGPNLLPNGGLQLVGTYRNGTGVVNGFLFQGTTADLSNSADYTTIDYPGATYTYVHSTMGGLAVGNADGPEGNAPVGTGQAFIDNIATGAFTNLSYPGALSSTAYGIWYNGGTSYTIAGGYSLPGEPGNGLSHGYLVDYDSLTGQFTHWTSFDYRNGLTAQTFATHFEGISSPSKGVYTIAADAVQVGATDPGQGTLLTVRRDTDGSFGQGYWLDLNDPSVDPTTNITSANSVAGGAVVGITIGSAGFLPFQSQVSLGFQLSNVISGNGGNGIGIYGGSYNRVSMNNIGTDASGSFRVGNAQNGILVTNGAVGNLIGGEVSNGNDPTAGVFARPPQGNLISGNGQNGVLLTGRATGNQLSGNFVGTSASGNSALGNRLDGVAIVGANNNSLIGCSFQNSPFVFYNVASGNGGNGVRVTNANNTTIQANFLGVGADNATIVANGGDGLLVSGTSRNTQVGGVIPLGNVISGNNRNGIEVRDRASGFVSFNTFGGLYAFGGAAPNRQNGILITSTGGNNLIRTSLIGGNLGNGIVLAGSATGVQITDTGVGTTSALNGPIPNFGDGILITGKANNDAIGGFQASIEPQNTVSSNGGYGIQVLGQARNNFVFNTHVGTTGGNMNISPLGNRLGGIDVGPGTSGIVIGGGAAALQVVDEYNGGNGISIRSSNGNKVLADQIAFNLGSGVSFTSSRNTQIGAAAAGNVIVANFGNGVLGAGVSTGSRVVGNLIALNAAGNVNLAKAKGVVYIP